MPMFFRQHDSAKYYYLKGPISQLHTDWVNCHCPISRVQHLPSYGQELQAKEEGTPHLQCYCKECSNLEMKGDALIKAGMVGPSSATRQAVEMTWCQYKASQFGYRTKIEMKEEGETVPIDELCETGNA